MHPLLHATIVRDSGTGSGPQTLFVLHGIFGSGRNWSAVMRQLVRKKPEWQALLVDLRQHGSSQGFPAPHTIEAAANDLFALRPEPAALLGHSFGGKVALMYAKKHGEALKQVWVIDSTPEARAPDGSAWQMLGLIRTVPREFNSRDELVSILTRFGIATPTAQWMATNLEPRDGVYRWRFDFDALEEMLSDFFRQDLWSVLENPPGECVIHMVKARESSVLTPGAVRRVSDLTKGGRVFLHHVGGGHWVNAENPDALLALMQQYL